MAVRSEMRTLASRCPRAIGASVAAAAIAEGFTCDDDDLFARAAKRLQPDGASWLFSRDSSVAVFTLRDSALRAEVREARSCAALRCGCEVCGSSREAVCRNFAPVRLSARAHVGLEPLAEAHHAEKPLQSRTTRRSPCSAHRLAARCLLQSLQSAESAWRALAITMMRHLG